MAPQAEPAKQQKLSVSFRKAAACDLPAVIDLYTTSFHKFVQTGDDLRGYFMDALGSPSQSLVVATDAEDKVAGFLLLSTDNSFRPGALNVDVIAVNDAYRGHGIGSQLMDFADKAALRNDFNAVTLQVHEENAGAIRLYERLGFTIVGEYPRYYRDGSNAYAMQKTFVPEEARTGVRYASAQDYLRKAGM